MNPELKREIILDNYTSPFHKETKTEGFIKENAANLSCIDNINIFIKIENNKIIGMTLEEANNFITNFENMINEKPYDKDILGEAIVFDEIYKQESRKTCATLSYRGLDKIIKGNH